MLSIEEREAILADHIRAGINGGWTVVTTTRTSATFEKRAELDVGVAIMCFLLCGIGLIVYLAVHFSRRPDVAYIVVQEDGQVTRTDSRR